MKFKFLAAALLGGALSLLAVGTASATPINTAGLSITVGDKTFSNFTCNIIGGGLFGPATCGTIDVTGIATDPLGLRFQSGFAATSNSNVDVLLGYKVTVNNPSQKINAIDLLFNGSFFGLAVTSVTETAFSGATPVGQVSVSNPPLKLFDTMPLTGAFSTLNIMKDILLLAGNGGLGTISFIDQRFHQVPEPGTLALVGLVLVGLGVSRKTGAKTRA